MASLVVDWTVPTACTSAIKMSKKVLVLNGETPLIHENLSEVFHLSKPGMKVILQEKTEKWIGVIESKWGKFK